MLSLNNIKSEFGSRKTSKRLGRGNGSGKGTTSGRGSKGQNSRSGGGVAPWFEGGQTPLFRRIPKLKGFSNAVFKVEYNIINISDLNRLIEKGITEIDNGVLLANRIIRNKNLGVKVLSQGELTGKISLKVEKVSKEALAKIEKAGGKVELMQK